MSAKIIIAIQIEHFELQKSAVVIRTGGVGCLPTKKHEQNVYTYGRG